ncbi:MAG: HAMP domain-containing sensor histidine kinase [Bacteroidota bacterium]
MNLSFLKNRPLPYIVLSGFVVMVFVELSLFNSSLKGKEKDFNDKLFNVITLYQDRFVRDSGMMNEWTGNQEAISLVQTRLKTDIDSLFNRNGIPLDYVFAVGKARPEANTGLMMAQKIWQGRNLFWSSDSSNNAGLIATKLRIAGIGPKGAENYYVKIFFPSKTSFLFRELLPLIIISLLTLLILFVCFLALLAIIRKQNALAELKNDFVNNMTHELKTPLFTISIASKMLAEQLPVKENNKYLSYVESIQQESARLTKLVDKVLQTSALEKKQLQLEKKETDLHLAIQSAIQNLELIRIEKRATITLFLNANRHRVYADETHMESVIYSLVDNAFKYSDGPAYITITTSNKNGMIQVAVADKGIGLDVETRGLIFERFFRANTGNLHEVKGFGIGLSYVKTIIEEHSGTITVQSTIGKGTEFILQLPLYDDDN